MATPQIIRVASKQELRSKISGYAAKGFSTLYDEGDMVTLSRKKPFNWILAVICLFIPIIGWIALIMMIMAASRGSEVVELHLAQA
jgi:hypothetical protein